jgi:hypothetical protein
MNRTYLLVQDSIGGHNSLKYGFPSVRCHFSAIFWPDIGDKKEVVLGCCGTVVSENYMRRQRHINDSVAPIGQCKPFGLGCIGGSHNYRRLNNMSRRNRMDSLMQQTW